MFATVGTDASFCHETRLGTFAYWITTDRGRILNSGVFKDCPTTSTEAEMMCIANALHHLIKLHPDTDLIYINTDCNTIPASMQRATELSTNPTRSTAYLLRKMIEGYNENGVAVVWRHIKGHQYNKKMGGTSAQYVNDWCDKEARRLLREAIKQLTQPVAIPKPSQKKTKKNGKHTPNWTPRKKRRG